MDHSRAGSLAQRKSEQARRSRRGWMTAGGAGRLELARFRNSVRPRSRAMFSWFRKSNRRQQLLAGPFPEAWLPHLHRNVFLYRLLPEAQQARLGDVVRVLVAEKFWEGCAGLEMTDEIKVTIAGQAGLLVLGLDDYYFDELKTVLIYPGGFLSRYEDPLGREGEVRRVLGQAAHGGPVVLSWWDACWGGR